ncbi:Uncharacterized protein PBTT_08547 [Plasmodiophora brassicae]|uniref:Uncharacterized protein n=2 Tax=Plasmodiophora brassicae TaxID=37360 RepID=A0A3P3YIN0_PLABS|nr:unnamed protein product [Plasmodiophora brassicae]
MTSILGGGTARISAKDWQDRCVTTTQVFGGTTISVAGLLTLFIIVAIATFPSVNPALTMGDIGFARVQMAIFAAIVATYGLLSMTVFVGETWATTKHDFWHGALLGYSVPLSLFLLAQATFWFQLGSATDAGVSVLSAMLSGLSFGGTFVYAFILAKPEAAQLAAGNVWMFKNRGAEISLLALFCLALLGAAVMNFIAASLPGLLSTEQFSLAWIGIIFIGAITFVAFMRYVDTPGRRILGSVFGVTLAVFAICVLQFFQFVAIEYKDSADRTAMAALLLNGIVAVLGFPVLISLAMMDFRNVRAGQVRAKALGAGTVLEVSEEA